MRKKALSDKAKGIIIGIIATLSAIGIISSVSISSAHTKSGDSDMNDMMNGMMMDDSTMSCMSMMKDQMTEEEIEEMLKDMDKDGDGICDMCGMSIEACREMMLS